MTTKYNAITTLRRGKRVVHAAIMGESRSLCGRYAKWMLAEPGRAFAPAQVSCARCLLRVERERVLAAAAETPAVQALASEARGHIMPKSPVLDPEQVEAVIGAYREGNELVEAHLAALRGESHKRHLCVLSSRDAATAANAINTLLTNAKTLGLTSRDLTSLRHALDRITQGTPDKTLLSAMFVKAGVAFETRVDSRFEDRDLTAVDVNVDDQSGDPLGTPPGYMGHVATFVFNHDGSLRSVLAWS